MLKTQRRKGKAMIRRHAEREGNIYRIGKGPKRPLGGGVTKNIMERIKTVQESKNGRGGASPFQGGK